MLQTATAPGWVKACLAIQGAAIVVLGVFLWKVSGSNNHLREKVDVQEQEINAFKELPTKWSDYKLCRTYEIAGIKAQWTREHARFLNISRQILSLKNDWKRIFTLEERAARSDDSRAKIRVRLTKVEKQLKELRSLSLSVGDMGPGKPPSSESDVDTSVENDLPPASDPQVTIIRNEGVVPDMASRLPESPKAPEAPPEGAGNP